MNHKRRRPKNRRGGCLLCKSWKANGAPLKERTPPSARRYTYPEILQEYFPNYDASEIAEHGVSDSSDVWNGGVGEPSQRP